MIRTRLLVPAIVSLALLAAACNSSDPSGAVADGPAPGDAIKLQIDGDSFRPAHSRSLQIRPSPSRSPIAAATVTTSP